MQTLLIEIKNKNAAPLLYNLEKLELIKVLNNSNTYKSKLSDKYKGIISKEQGTELQEHIKQMRSEWNNI